MRIGIMGAAGRMGRTLLAEVLDNPACTLSAAMERAGSPFIDKDVGALIGREETGVIVTDSMATLVDHADAVIDFTTPAATLELAEMVASHGKIHVSGTTGLTDNDRHTLAHHAKQARIIWSSNMSVGVNILNILVEQVAHALNDEFDIDIVEMHHRKKVDAPSGTALTLGEMAARGRGVDFNSVAKLSREGITGEHPRGEIGFATLRGGDVIGDHTVIFAGDGERIELTHKASSRVIYAKGAVRACLWAKHQQAGKLYHIRDVLGM